MGVEGPRLCTSRLSPPPSLSGSWWGRCMDHVCRQWKGPGLSEKSPGLGLRVSGSHGGSRLSDWRVQLPCVRSILLCLCYTWQCVRATHPACSWPSWALSQGQDSEEIRTKTITTVMIIIASNNTCYMPGTVLKASLTHLAVAKTLRYCMLLLFHFINTEKLSSWPESHS